MDFLDVRLGSQSVKMRWLRAFHHLEVREGHRSMVYSLDKMFKLNLYIHVYSVANGFGCSRALLHGSLLPLPGLFNFLC